MEVRPYYRQILEVMYPKQREGKEVSYTLRQAQQTMTQPLNYVREAFISHKKERDLQHSVQDHFPHENKAIKAQTMHNYRKPCKPGSIVNENKGAIL